jgi:hypothetical protein
LRLAAAALAGFLAFLVLATANGAGYRYGVSDGAAYVPAVLLAENPAAFPRDAPLIRTQGQFFVVDEVLAAIGRVTGASLESRFFAAYVVAIAAVWAGVILIGSSLYRTDSSTSGADPSGPRSGPFLTGWWLTIALAAVITLRHHIPRTSTNSLEPYFHPRLLAFGFGIIAVAAFLRRRNAVAVALVGLAAICHGTTAFWFAVVIGTGLMIVDRRWRLPGLLGSAVALAILVWAAAAGPLRTAASTMDPIWIDALGGRNFIFANEWPLWAWIANLGLLGILWLAHTVRVRRGTATVRDTGLVWGATALVALFLATLPLVSAHVALAVQFQFSRVFWVVDFLAALYLIAAAGESLRRTQAATLAVVLLTASAARATYIMWSEHAERRLFQVSLGSSPWMDAMHWIAGQPLDVHVMAAADHAFKYGVSVRVAACRDVLLEDDKDSAVAMYSRAIAERVVERRKALADFSRLTAESARELATRFGVDYLVTEAALPLREVYRNTQFRIYALKPAGPVS